MAPAKSATPAHRGSGDGRQTLEHLAGRLKLKATLEAVGSQVSTIAPIVIAIAPIGRGLFSRNNLRPRDRRIEQTPDIRRGARLALRGRLIPQRCWRCGTGALLASPCVRRSVSRPSCRSRKARTARSSVATGRGCGVRWSAPPVASKDEAAIPTGVGYGPTRHSQAVTCHQCRRRTGAHARGLPSSTLSEIGRVTRRASAKPKKSTRIIVVAERRTQ